MRAALDLVRGMVAVLATVLVVVGLLGFGTSISDPNAVLRSAIAAIAGAVVLSVLLTRNRRHVSLQRVRSEDRTRG